jgi:hypothetical protein
MELLGPAPSLAYATARHNNGNRDLVFLELPPGTSISNNAEYKAYCENAGFVQNQNQSTNSNYTNAGMQNSSAYYCTSYCCYLGSGNSQANNLSNFQNFGLALGSYLRVRDRGCGDYQGNFTNGQNTTDGLRVNNGTSFTYNANHFGGHDYGSSSPNSFSQQAVIVCQAP